MGTASEAGAGATRGLLSSLEKAIGSLSPEAAAAATRLIRAGSGRLSQAEAEPLELEVRSFCHRYDLPETLADGGRPEPYVFKRAYAENASPMGTPPDLPLPGNGGWKLLGHEVGYPLGVPASVLTAKATWIDYFSRFGFNIFTFKTVRSAERREFEFPNWVYLQGLDSPLALDTEIADLTVRGNLETYFRRIHSYSTANSFGVPSNSPEKWQQQIGLALEQLDAGKLLIVSVMGTEEDNDGSEDAPQHFVADFVRTAELAVEAGAPAIELNLSCPNKVNPQGKMIDPLCDDPGAVQRIVSSVRGAVDREIPIVAKLGYLRHEQLAELLPLIVDDVAGIAGINTLPVKVIDPQTGEMTFPGRDEAGLSGVALRYFALDFVQSLHRLRQANDGWDFDILAMGGVMDAHDVRALMAAGADSVQTATAAATNPALPQQLHYGQQPDNPGDLTEIREALLDADGKIRPAAEVAERLDLEPGDIGSLFDTPYDLPRFVAELMAFKRERRVGTKSSDPQASSLRSESVLTHKDRARQATALNAALRQDRLMKVVDSALTIAAAAKRMGLEVEEVERLVEVGDLLALETADGRRIPSWQLTAEFPARPLEGLDDVARAVSGSLEIASGWLEEANPDLDGRSPQEVLQAGDYERVLAAAKAIGAAGR
jgi:dihydroorotate dehydrogenase